MPYFSEYAGVLPDLTGGRQGEIREVAGDGGRARGAGRFVGSRRRFESTPNPGAVEPRRPGVGKKRPRGGRPARRREPVDGEDAARTAQRHERVRTAAQRALRRPRDRSGGRPERPDGADARRTV